LNPQTWVPKASTLPLDHRSRFITFIVNEKCKNLEEIPEIFRVLSMKMDEKQRHEEGAKK
jgi:hypothetical protein